MLLTLLFTPWN